MARFLVIGVTLLGAIWPLQAFSDPLLQTVSVPVGVEYDSNPTMIANDPSSIMRYRVMPQYQLSYKGDSNDLTFSLGARLERSSDQALSVNRQDPNLGLSWQTFSPTSSFGVNLRYAQESARTTEFQDSAAVTVDATRTTAGLGANWKNSLSERNDLTLTADYSDVSYDSPTLTDFQNTRLGATLGHQFNERSELFVTGSASRFEPGQNAVRTAIKSESYIAMLGFKSKSSENFDWLLQGGGVSITSNGIESHDWQGNWRINYAGERLSGSLDIGRTTTASGVTGGFATNDALRFQASYLLSERSSLAFDASTTKSESTLSTTTDIYGATYSRELSPFFRLNLRVQRRAIEREINPASSNLVGLTLIYSHPDF